ncbi:LOW QUALITY PROTEIN: hypothetical protein QTO34_016159 [Cnephaeus nilssonii]|uniref:Cadherin domain-containing protein n=1 Tax=Cnephaeus nilssonii TaxID=3371016 RepID=A0AA40LTT8_CNENI|nr:LOW QUALITY PROTEIN: hypothetical protein QTO34_016159 [Eptesicus nilssonii]
MAVDGGKPELTGTTQLMITILDVNDNAPAFERSVYKVRLFENAPNGTLAVIVNASDLDEGVNKDIVYSFNTDTSADTLSKFHLDPVNGHISVKGNLDFEETKLYEIQVEATDKGTPPMADHCTVLVEILDTNDNVPELVIKSLSLPVLEDAPLGTIIALISVSDLDSGINGQITCTLSPHVPFKLVSTFKNYYSLVLDSALDRESVSGYAVVVTARDGGSPSLSATASVSVEVADVNDNAPLFAQPEYTVFVKENNPPGCHIFTVSARDVDAQENALVSYSLVERRVGERALSSYVSVHAESGKVYALQPLDHEELELLQFQVSARDAGVPPLGSNVTLQVFVLDENDNAPALLPPGAGAGGSAVSELVSRLVGAGHVVAKVRAVDADSGYNAWLSYELLPAAGGARSPFRVGQYTGEISTTRALDEADLPRQRLLVLVKDHGEPALAVTATVLLSLVESGQAPKTRSKALAGVVSSETALVDVNVYLIIAICAVSSLLVLTLLLYTALRCSALPTQGACGPRKPVLVCSSAVGSWSSSQQRQRRVCSGEGPPKTDLMAFSPGLPPGPFSGDTEEQRNVDVDVSAKMLENGGCNDTGLNGRKISFDFEIRSLNEMEISWGRGQESRRLLLSLLFFTTWKVGSGQIHYSVPEEAKHGTFVGRIAQDLGLELAELVPRLFWVASKAAGTSWRGRLDADIGENALLTYRLSSNEYFSLEKPSKGEQVKRLGLVLRKLLDREEAPEIVLVLTATDGGKPELTGTIQLHITVLDANDNPPAFDRTLVCIMVEVEDTNDNVPVMEFKSLSLPVREDASLGTVIALIRVSDLDSGVNGQVTCTLSPHVPFRLVSTFKNYYSLVLDSAWTARVWRTMSAGRGLAFAVATASVSVEVADVNDNAPVFAQPEHTVFVKENNPPGCHIFTVSARDVDAQENALVSYSLVERRVGERALSSYVSVHAESGKVYALQPLDHEELELLQFQVSARDAGVPPLGSNVTLQVFVLDENDNAPALLPPGAGAGGSAVSESVSRSVGAGHVVAKVRAVDADSGYNAWLSYELLPAAGGARSPFRVGLYTGEISTTRALDEADTPRQRLLVLVKDHGEPALAVTATVLLSLVDSGQAPKASWRESSGTASAETALADVNVYLIIAICAVSSLLVLTLLLYTALRCSALPTEGVCGPGKPVLVCSSAVGSWSYSQRRRQRVCSGEGPPKTDLMAFSPSVPDSGDKDQQPATGNSLSKRLKMKSLGGRERPGPLLRPRGGQARHLRGPHRAGPGAGAEELVPRLFRVASKGRGDLLEVNLQNGILFVNSRIDREELCGRSLECSIHLEVVVERPLQVFHVEVAVKDINDNPPSWCPPSRITIHWCWTAPDREKCGTLWVVVTARDGGSPSLSATASLSVEVADVNDNAPVFAQPEYTVFVKENNPPGCHIFTVSARDVDAQENALVSYSLVERRVGERALSSYVSVHAESGKVYALQPLDHEELELLQFQVSARDAGVPPLGSNVTLQVFVLDENDNAPALLPPGAGAGGSARVVSRLVGAGHVVAKVRAVDADSGYNAWLSYELLPAGGARSPFRVGLYTGEISTTRALDEADTPRQRLLVLVKDHGEPRPGAQSLMARVLWPREREGGPCGRERVPDHRHLRGVQPVGAFAAAVHGSAVLHAATEGACGPGKPVLVCSSAVGQLVVLTAEAAEGVLWGGAAKTDLMAFSPSLPQGPSSEDKDLLLEIKQQVFDMVITPEGRLGSRCLLLSLMFLAVWEAGSGQVHYSVPEEAKHGTFVGRIAQDLGLELAELVPRLFRVASKGRGDLLEVNLQNGILFVNSRIDREELCGRSLECSIHLEVVVERPLQVFHVEVAVKDINDNPPVFPVKEQRVLIYESRLPDSLFPLEGASDEDVGVNSILTYKLSSSEYFTLDVKTNSDDNTQIGLVLRKSLDREETPEHNLLLMATDGGKPELTGSVQVLVTVMDVNDNAPSFQQSEYEVRIFENSDNGTVVIRLNASDPDEGINQEVSYSFNSFVPPMVIDQFSIDSKSGEIRIRKNLDFEKVSSYKIRIDATDRGHPPMAGHCTVLVKVLDINDNAPQISLTSVSFPVSEDAPLGSVIALISVYDQDAGVNGQVTCLLMPHGPFRLVSTFKNYYSLVLDSALDREKVSHYELVVTARDQGSPSLSATASVSVEVADVNDNAPLFPQPEYTVFVKENNPPGCHIFTVSARDVDAQENALVSYSLVERRVGERALSSYVSVHAESGKVYALQPLDHEELELLQFQVSARDAGVPPLGSNVTLQVFVLDENDNAPALLPPGAGAGGSAVSESVSRSVGAGHVVAKVRAVDADSGYNAWLSYELLPAAGGARSPFRVGLYTGEISTTRALDEADSPRQRLLVLVKDHGEPALMVHRHRAAVAGGQRAEAALADVNVYLIIAICAVSSLLVLSLLLYTALRCSAPPTDGASEPRKPVLVCSSAVGSWSYSQQRRQRVCSGEGPPKTDLMAFSPSLPQGPSSADNSRLMSLSTKKFGLAKTQTSSSSPGCVSKC